MLFLHMCMRLYKHAREIDSAIHTNFCLHFTTQKGLEKVLSQNSHFSLPVQKIYNIPINDSEEK